MHASIATPADLDRIKPYEERLARDLSFAVAEFDRFFGPNLAPFATLRRLVDRLEALGADYAVAGSLACFVHGRRKVTPNLDVLLSRDGLAAVRTELVRHGYRPSPDRNTLFDARAEAPIRFLSAGRGRGDVPPAPEAILLPDPMDDAVEIDGVRYLSLRTLIERTLASGLTAPNRSKGSQ